MDVSTLHIPVDQFFSLICQTANIGCWLIDIKNRETWWSDTYYEMLGIENKFGTDSVEYFIDNIVHPSDRYIITSSVKKHLYENCGHLKNELRLRHQDGFYNWYEVFSETRLDEAGKVAYILGGIINIDEKKQHEVHFQKLKSLADVTEDMMGIGTWERDLITGKRTFSKLVYDIFELPYDAPISEMNRDDFYSEKDAKILTEAMKDLIMQRKPFDLELQLITAKKNKVWIRTMGKPILDANEKEVIGLRGIIQKIEKQKIKENFLLDIRDRINEQKFFLDETSTMSNVGGWELTLEHNDLFWSYQTKKIHEVPDSYMPVLEEAFAFYTEESRSILSVAFSKLVEKGESFDLELQIVTGKSNQIWVRSIGKPVYHLGKIAKVRGVIQDINAQKIRELEIQSALNIIEEQNSKLKDFTHIVSHNLRSHSGNLKMITEMVELEPDMETKLEWIDLIKNVSTSLSETVNNLTGLVSMNVENKKKLSLQKTFANVQKSINYRILNEEAEITTDFSAYDTIEYVPAYLESIMLNLITNAIKYRHPDRKPVISLCSGLQCGKPFLKVKDNGQGIDLEKYGNRLFKMNQTFHHNSDARGIGLYITKNQVENMGGTIEVESAVNEGTTFIIHF